MARSILRLAPLLVALALAMACSSREPASEPTAGEVEAGTPAEDGAAEAPSAPVETVDPNEVMMVPARLTVNADEAGAVFIDGRRLADTTPLETAEVAPGRHRVQLAWDDGAVLSDPRPALLRSDGNVILYLRRADVVRPPTDPGVVRTEDELAEIDARITAERGANAPEGSGEAGPDDTPEGSEDGGENGADDTTEGSVDDTTEGTENGADDTTEGSVNGTTEGSENGADDTTEGSENGTTEGNENGADDTTEGSVDDTTEGNENGGDDSADDTTEGTVDGATDGADPVAEGSGAPAEPTGTGWLRIDADEVGTLYVDGHRTELTTPVILERPAGEVGIQLVFESGDLSRHVDVSIVDERLRRVRFEGRELVVIR